MATGQENHKIIVGGCNIKPQTVSDLYGKVFAEMWPSQKREETKDGTQMEQGSEVVEQVRSSKGRFDPQGLLEIPENEREAIERLTLIVHYYSDVEDALRTVTDASFVVQFEDLFQLEQKKVSEVNRTNLEDEKNGEQEEGVIAGPLRTLAPTLVVLKSFKPTALLTLVQALPSIVHLQLVILSKSPFSGSQAEFMRDYLRFVGPNLVSLQMWIHALHDRNAQDEVVSNLDRVWSVVDREMLKLQHLTLEVQQNFPKGRTHTPKLDNIMTRLREFRFGSLDGSTNLDRTLDYLGQDDETVPFVKGEYSQFFNSIFLTTVKADYWPRLVQMGMSIDLVPIGGPNPYDFCGQISAPVQFHFDLSKETSVRDKQVLKCIPSRRTMRALRLRYSHEQHLLLWPRETSPAQKSPNSYRIVSLQLDVINVDCSTFKEGKFPDLFPVTQHLPILRGLVIFFDDCISDYYELPGSEDGQSYEFFKEALYAKRKKEEAEKYKKQAMFRKQAKMLTHREYYEKYASYLIEAGVLEHKLLQAVRIKFGAKRTLEYTREQLLDEKAKQEALLYHKLRKGDFAPKRFYL